MTVPVATWAGLRADKANGIFARPPGGVG